MHANPHIPPPISRRIIAAGLGALVLVVAMLSAAPALHKHLHDDADHADHECAIVYLAHGVTLATTIAAAPAPEIVWLENFPATPESLFITSPKHLLPLKCGPPERA